MFQHLSLAALLLGFLTFSLTFIGIFDFVKKGFSFA